MFETRSARSYVVYKSRKFIFVTNTIGVLAKEKSPCQIFFMVDLFVVRVHDPHGLKECLEEAEHYKPDPSDVQARLDEQLLQQNKLSQPTRPKFWWHSYPTEDFHVVYRTVYQRGIIGRYEGYQRQDNFNDAARRVGTFKATVEHTNQGVVVSSWETDVFVYRRTGQACLYGPSDENTLYYGLNWKDAVRCTTFNLDIQKLPEPEPNLIQIDNDYYYKDALERLPRSSHRAKACTLLYKVAKTDLNKLMPTPLRVVRHLAGLAVEQQLVDKKVYELCSLLLPMWSKKDGDAVLLRLAAKQPSISRKREVEAYFKEHASLQVEQLGVSSSEEFSHFKMHFVREINVKRFFLKDVEHLISLLEQATKCVVQKRYRYRREHHDVPRGFELTERPRGKELCVARRIRHPRRHFAASSGTRFTVNYKHVGRRSKKNWQGRTNDKPFERALNDRDIQDAMDAMVQTDLDEQQQADIELKSQLEDCRDMVGCLAFRLLNGHDEYGKGVSSDRIDEVVKQVVGRASYVATYDDKVVLSYVAAVLEQLGFSYLNQVGFRFDYYKGITRLDNKIEHEEQEDQEPDQQKEEQEEEEQQEEEQQEEEQQEKEEQQEEASSQQEASSQEEEQQEKEEQQEEASSQQEASSKEEEQKEEEQQKEASSQEEEEQQEDQQYQEEEQQEDQQYQEEQHYDYVLAEATKAPSKPSKYGGCMVS